MRCIMWELSGAEQAVSGDRSAPDAPAAAPQLQEERGPARLAAEPRDNLRGAGANSCATTRPLPHFHCTNARRHPPHRKRARIHSAQTAEAAAQLEKDLREAREAAARAEALLASEKATARQALDQLAEKAKAAEKALAAERERAVKLEGAVKQAEAQAGGAAKTAAAEAEKAMAEIKKQQQRAENAEAALDKAKQEAVAAMKRLEASLAGEQQRAGQAEAALRAEKDAAAKAKAEAEQALKAERAKLAEMEAEFTRKTNEVAVRAPQHCSSTLLLSLSAPHCLAGTTENATTHPPDLHAHTSIAGRAGAGAASGGAAPRAGHLRPHGDERRARSRTEREAGPAHLDAAGAAAGAAGPRERSRPGAAAAGRGAARAVESLKRPRAGQPARG